MGGQRQPLKLVCLDQAVWGRRVGEWQGNTFKKPPSPAEKRRDLLPQPTPQKSKPPCRHATTSPPSKGEGAFPVGSAPRQGLVPFGQKQPGEAGRAGQHRSSESGEPGSSPQNSYRGEVGVCLGTHRVHALERGSQKSDLLTWLAGGGPLLSRVPGRTPNLQSFPGRNIHGPQARASSSSSAAVLKDSRPT